MRYIPELDGLRGIAILMVFCFNYDPGLLPGGWLGVEFFFVLSGFLITSLWLAEYADAGEIDLKAFFIRRALRLLPALTVLLTVYALLSLIRGAALGEVAISLLAVLFHSANWARAFGWPVELRHLGHTWSLSIVEQFYLLWPLALLGLLALAKNTRRIAAILCAVVAGIAVYRASLSIGGAPVDRLYNGFDTRADGLLIGAIVAFAPSNRLSRVYLVIALVVLAAFAVIGDYNSQAFYLGLLTVVATWTALLLSWIVSNPRVELLRFAPLVWVGRISYGLYLWHYPVIQAKLLLSQSAAAQFAFNLAASLVMAAASFYLVEKPFLRAKRKFRRAKTLYAARAVNRI